MSGLLSSLFSSHCLAGQDIVFFISSRGIPVHSLHGAKLWSDALFSMCRSLGVVVVFHLKDGVWICFCYFVSPAIAGDSEGGGWLVEIIGASKRASTYSEVVHLCLPVCDTWSAYNRSLVVSIRPLDGWRLETGGLNW